jgi:A/G-specific adenine glycosylase
MNPSQFQKLQLFSVFIIFSRPFFLTLNTTTLLHRTVVTGFAMKASSSSSSSSRRKITQTFLPLKEVTSSSSLSATATASSSDDNIGSSNKNNNNNLLLSDEELWNNWVTHDDISFHHFDPDAAVAIRSALLEWYYAERRKLPWRGDPPPYDGSTAGINAAPTSSSKKTKKSKETDKGNKQTKLDSFFQTKQSKSKSQKQSEVIQSEEAVASSAVTTLETGAVIPVTGYGVWVSEIMLQQTRVEAVIPYWIKWMKSFPTVQDLANATEEEVNAHWAGLGFYRRARLLHQGAKHVVDELDGQLPTTVEGLLKVSGIGPYTAAAVASIAYGQCAAVVDGNVCRVLSRLTGIANHIKAPALKDKHGFELANQLVRAGDGKNPGDVNQALMELGATYCAPSGSGIDPRDPLKDFYMSTRLGKIYAQLPTKPTVAEVTTKCVICDAAGISSAIELFESKMNATEAIGPNEAARHGHSIFPLAPPKTKTRDEDLAVVAIQNTWKGETWWLLMKRPSTGLLAGQWEFPSTIVQVRKSTSTKAPSVATRRKELAILLEDITRRSAKHQWICDLDRTKVNPSPMEHVFSHVKHIMFIDTASSSVELEHKEWVTENGKEVRWMRESDMKKVGITSGVKKILKAVKEQGRESSPVGKKRKR